MKLLAIDPGTTQSAYVMLDEKYRILSADKVDNETMIAIIADAPGVDVVVIEDMEPRYTSGDRSAAGAVMGASTIQTIKWMGQFGRQAAMRGLGVDWIFRRDERSALIPTKKNGLPPLPPGTPAHADGQIRASLIQRFARYDTATGKGTKKEPDVFYGFAGDMWQAMAVGVTWLDKRRNAKEAAQCEPTKRTRKR